MYSDLVYSLQLSNELNIYFKREYCRVFFSNVISNMSSLNLYGQNSEKHTNQQILIRIDWKWEGHAWFETYLLRLLWHYGFLKLEPYTKNKMHLYHLCSHDWCQTLVVIIDQNGCKGL